MPSCCALTPSQRALRKAIHADGFLLPPPPLPPPLPAPELVLLAASRGAGLLPLLLLTAAGALPEAAPAAFFLRPGLPPALLLESEPPPADLLLLLAALDFDAPALAARGLLAFAFVAFGCAATVGDTAPGSALSELLPAAFAALAAFRAAFFARSSTAVCTSSSSGATPCTCKQLPSGAI